MVGFMVALSVGVALATVADDFGGEAVFPSAQAAMANSKASAEITRILLLTLAVIGLTLESI